MKKDKKSLMRNVGIFVLVIGAILAFSALLFSITARSESILEKTTGGFFVGGLTLIDSNLYKEAAGCSGVKIEWKVNYADGKVETGWESPLSDWSNTYPLPTNIVGYTLSRSFQFSLARIGYDGNVNLQARYYCTNPANYISGWSSKTLTLKASSLNQECTTDRCLADGKVERCVRYQYEDARYIAGYCGSVCTTSSQCSSGEVCTDGKCFKDCSIVFQDVCDGNEVWKYSCGKYVSKVDTCLASDNEVCKNGACVRDCGVADDRRCKGTEIWLYNDCDEARVKITNCVYGCADGQCNAAPTSTCTSAPENRCEGNVIYSYLCGVKGEQVAQCTGEQLCENGECNDVTCQSQQQVCKGNEIWVNNCGQESFATNCGTDQCVNGVCEGQEGGYCPSVIPTKPCNDAIWSGYPSCRWEGSCPDTPTGGVIDGGDIETGALTESQGFRFIAGAFIAIIGLALIVSSAI